MSFIHISTDETFLHDAPVVNGECSICTIKSDLRFGYGGTKCDVCGSCHHSDELWMGFIAKKRREIMKLNRKQMGQLTGYSPDYITNCEWTSCSKAYFDKTTALIKNHFGQWILHPPVSLR